MLISVHVSYSLPSCGWFQLCTIRNPLHTGDGLYQTVFKFYLQKNEVTIKHVKLILNQRN